MPQKTFFRPELKWEEALVIADWLLAGKAYKEQRGEIDPIERLTIGNFLRKIQQKDAIAQLAPELYKNQEFMETTTTTQEKRQFIRGIDERTPADLKKIATEDLEQDLLLTPLPEDQTQMIKDELNRRKILEREKLITRIRPPASNTAEHE